MKNSEVGVICETRHLTSDINKLKCSDLIKRLKAVHTCVEHPFLTCMNVLKTCPVNF